MEEWVTDEDGLNYSTGDKTDWKTFQVPRDGTLFVEVACDNPKAAVVVGLYDRYGRRLIEKRKKRGLSDHITFEGDIQKGKYFLRLATLKSEDNTGYTLQASIEGGSAVGDIAPPE